MDSYLECIHQLPWEFLWAGELTGAKNSWTLSVGTGDIAVTQCLPGDSSYRCFSYQPWDEQDWAKRHIKEQTS